MNKKGTFYLCVAYLFFIMCASAGFVSVFGYLPEYVGGSLMQVSGANSVMSVLMALTAAVAAVLFKKIGTKVCMIAGGIGMIVFSVMLSFMPNVPSLYIAYAIAGIVQSIAGMTCVSEVLVKTYGAESGKYITVCVGSLLVACGASQGLAGILYDNVGMQSVFMLGSMIPAVAATVLAVFIKTPKNTEEIAVDANPTGETVEVKKVNVYSNPAVWLFWLATAILVGVLLPILMYATVYFPQYGMSISGAATLVSILGFATGAFNLFLSAKVLGKLGIKKYVFLVLICCAIVPAIALLYAKVPSMLVIVLMVVFYAVGCTISQLHAVVSPMVFGLNASSEVMTKAAAFQGAGNIIWPLLFAKVITSGGMVPAFIIAIVATVIGLVLYALAFVIMNGKAVE